MKTIRETIKRRDEQERAHSRDAKKTNDIICVHIKYLDVGNCLHDEIIRGPTDKVEFYVNLIDHTCKRGKLK